MKDFITTIAAIMLLMIFLLQFVTNQAVFTSLAGAEFAVKEFRLTAEKKKSISDLQLRELREKTAERLGCSVGEVSVSINERSADIFGAGEATDTKDVSYYEYRVQMPICGLIAAADFLGISESENRITYTSEGFICIKEDVDEEPDCNSGAADAVQYAHSLPDGI